MKSSYGKVCCAIHQIKSLQKTNILVKKLIFGNYQMKTFPRCKKLIEYRSNNPYDEVCDSLVLDLIKHALDEKSLCKVQKLKSS